VYVGDGQSRYFTTGFEIAVTIIGDACILEE